MDARIARGVIEAVRTGKAGAEEPAGLMDARTWAWAEDYAARMHALLPWLAAIRGAPGYGRIDLGSRLRMEEKLSRERMRLAILDAELDEAVFALIAARIPVIVLKGMELARRYYPERVRRPMADVDLLVPRDGFVSALRALAKSGYRRVAADPGDTQANEWRNRMELSRRPGGPVVELHDSPLAREPDPRVSEAWQRARFGEVPGLPRQVGALAFGDNLAFLTRHCAVQHALESPIWLNDLHYLISSPDASSDAEWDRAAEILRSSRSRAAGWFVGLLLSRHWGTPIRMSWVAGVGEKLGFLHRTLLERLANPLKWFPPEGRSLAWTLRSRFLLRDGPVDAFRYGVRRRKAPAATSSESETPIGLPGA